MKNEAKPSDSQCTKIFLCWGDVLNLEASRATLQKLHDEIQRDECVDPLLNFYAENKMQYTNHLHVDLRRTREIFFVARIGRESRM